MNKKLFEICLTVAGKSITQFAAELGVSVPTVYNALNNPERSKSTASKIQAFIEDYRTKAAEVIEEAA
jgi:transposase